MTTERCVLVVDDSPTMRQLIRFALKRVGAMRVIEANNGEEALAHLSTEPVDLVLTDVNMPVMDGITLIERIRAQPPLEKVPIVVITTEGEQTERDRAFQKGATDYLVKPVQGTAVANVVRKALGG